jgi:hypothetical protein
MGILDSLTGYMASENEETLRQKKMEESLRMAEEASQQNFWNNFVSQNYKDLPPDQLSGAFNQMGASYTHAPGIQKQFQEAGRTLSGSPNPMTPPAPGMELGPEPGVGESPYEKELYKIDLQLAQPNISFNERAKLKDAQSRLRISVAAPQQNAFEKRQTIQEGLDMLRAQGAGQPEIEDYIAKAYGGLNRENTSTGNLPVWQAVDASGQGRPAVDLQQARGVPGLFYNAATGQPFDLNDGWQLSRPPFDRRLGVADINGNYRIISTATAKQVGETLPGIAKPGASLTPEAQGAVLGSTGGDVNQAAAMVPGAYPKSQIINRGAKGAKGTIPLPPTTPGQVPPIPGVPGQTPPVQPGTEPTPFFSPKMTAQAQKTLQQIRFPLSELTRVRKSLDDIGTPQGRLTWQRIAYAMGFKTPNSALIADLSRVRVIGAAIYTSAAGSRALGLIDQAEEHLADPWTDQTALAKDKIDQAIRALQDYEQEVIRTGGTGLTQEQAAKQTEQRNTPPPLGAPTPPQAGGKRTVVSTQPSASTGQKKLVYSDGTWEVYNKAGKLIGSGR